MLDMSNTKLDNTEMSTHNSYRKKSTLILVIERNLCEFSRTS